MSKKDLPPKEKGPAPVTIPPEPASSTEVIKNSRGPAPYTLPKQPE